MPQMLGVRRKYRIRRFFGSGVAFFVTLTLFIVLAQAAVGMYSKSREAQEKRDDALAELRRLEARETDLQTEISRLSSDRGIEEELRDRYFVAREGERVAVIRTDLIAQQQNTSRPEEKGFWKKVFSAVVFWGADE